MGHQERCAGRKRRVSAKSFTILGKKRKKTLKIGSLLSCVLLSHTRSLEIGSWSHLVFIAGYHSKALRNILLVGVF